jgi:ectoine hydroxylase-related dioxygenase (phytanoyl-CoA dioxygenase family)
MVEWFIAVSPAERAGGELSPQSLRQAELAFQKYGCALLRGVFEASTLDAMHADYVARYAAMDSTRMQAEAERPPPTPYIRVGDARYDITLRMNGAFGRPEVFANRLLCGLLATLLGDDMNMSSLTLVVSHPGAAMQHGHRDFPHLFADPGIGPGLPPYAINVAVPLIDVDHETGPTGVWLGSHRWQSHIPNEQQKLTVCSFERGDCLLLDYRTVHAGMPNRTARARPIVYMVYARRWFADFRNHAARASLDITPEEWQALPESARALLLRAFFQPVQRPEPLTPSQATERT